MSQPSVFLNGEWLPAGDAHLAIFDAGLVMGAAVTDQIRTFRHRLFRLDDHLDRFMQSLHYMGLDTGLTRIDLSTISQRLIEQNAKLIAADEDLGLVWFATPGEYSNYARGTGRAARLGPTICAHTFPLALVQWAKAMRDGVHLIVAATRHVPPSCFDSKVKYRSRLHYYLAEREARAIDHEAMALLLDLEGNVTETNTGNVLIVTKGVVETPTTTNTLPGVSRAVVMELAGELGLTCRERDLQIHDILRADEMFLSSTPYCLLPVTRVSGVPVGSGRPGPWHRRLLSIWSERVGVDIAEQMTNGLEG